MEDDEESHHGDSTLNSHNSSFQAGGTTNRHQRHSTIVAKPTHGRHLLRIFIQISPNHRTWSLVPGQTTACGAAPV